MSSKNLTVSKLKEDVQLTPRRRSARITERLKIQAENSEQDSTDNEVQEVGDEGSKRVVKTKTPRKSNKVTKTPSRAIEVVDISDSESSVEVIKPDQKAQEKNLLETVSNEKLEPLLDKKDSSDTTNSLKEVSNNDKEPKSNNSETKSETTTKSANKEQDKENNRRISNHLNMMRLGNKKSGRFWKSDRDRFRSVVKSKGLKESAQKRIAQKQELLRVKEYEKSLKEDVKRLREEKKQRTEENKKKREENAKKNEIVQVIKNPAKIKRMKKKQLRMLAKRDVTKVV